MNGTNRTICMRRVVSWLLAVMMSLSLFTGCQKSSENIQTVNPGETSEVNPEPVITDVNKPDWKPVTTGAEIDTLNVVLVIDTSASTLRNDPDRNWIEASCMFLNTLYASANKQATERLAGSKHANVGVILYNDTAVQFSESLMNLATKETVDELKTFVRKARIEGGDDALADALEKAVAILNSHRPFKELSERSVILLFTDGYTGYQSDILAQSGSNINEIPAQYESIAGSDATTTDGPPAFVSGSNNADSNDGPPSYVSGGNSSTTVGGPPAYVTAAASEIPDFGDSHQPQLLDALNSAKTNKYEIFVAMLNPDSSIDAGWDQFKLIADYTRRNLMGELMPIT